MSKHAFWQALIFTIVIFGLGLLLGVFLEDSREDSARQALLKSELNILDDQLRDRIIEDFGVDCDLAKKSLFDFADKIYDEAFRLEVYDGSSQFNRESFYTLHRRYDLLRTLLWTEAVTLKDTCDEDFHTVVYLYEYASDDIDVESKQNFYSRLLLELKEKYEGEILLIPIAGNTELSSVELLKENYGISELPILIIDEDRKVNEIVTLEELEDIIF